MSARARGLGGGLARAATAVAAVTVAARVVGLLRIVVFNRTVGPTSLGDTYQTANTLPNIIFEVVAGGALASVVVPLLAGPLQRADREALRQTASALLTWSVLVLVPVVLVGLALRRPLMGVLTAGVADDAERSAKVAAGARMLAVFLPQVVLYGAAIVLTGILQAHRRFVGPALAPLLSSVVVIGAYLLFATRTGPRPDLGGTSPAQQLILSVGTTAGVAALALSLALPVSRLGLGLRPALRLPAGVGARLGRLSLAGAAGVVAQQLSLAVVLFLANPQPGSVVLYQSAFTVFLLPWAVLAVPISVTAFPSLATAAEAGDEPTYSRTASAGLLGVLLASLAAAAVLVATSLPVARLLLGLDGDGDPARVGELRLGIVALAPGLVGYGVLAFVTRALYARRLARVPAVATVVGFTAVVATDLLLVRLVVDVLDQPQWRVAALGLGNTVGMTLAGVLLVRALRRAAGPAVGQGLRRALLAGVPAAVAAAGVATALAAVCDPGGQTGAVLAGLVAAVGALGVFVGVLAAARVPEVGWVRSALSRAGTGSGRA